MHTEGARDGVGRHASRAVGSTARQPKSPQQAPGAEDFAKDDGCLSFILQTRSTTTASLQDR